MSYESWSDADYERIRRIAAEGLRNAPTDAQIRQADAQARLGAAVLRSSPQFARTVESLRLVVLGAYEALERHQNEVRTVAASLQSVVISMQRWLDDNPEFVSALDAAFARSATDAGNRAKEVSKGQPQAGQSETSLEAAFEFATESVSERDRQRVQDEADRIELPLDVVWAYLIALIMSSYLGFSFAHPEVMAFIDRLLASAGLGSTLLRLPKFDR